MIALRRFLLGLALLLWWLAIAGLALLAVLTVLAFFWWLLPR